MRLVTDAVSKLKLRKFRNRTVTAFLKSTGCFQKAVNIMQLHKTSLAKEVLARHGAELSQAQRRVLILCDGERSIDRIVGMLGMGALADIDGLVKQGFISHDGRSAGEQIRSRPENGVKQLLGSLRSKRDEVAKQVSLATESIAQARAAKSATNVTTLIESAHSTPAPAATAPVNTTRPAQRRSIAAAKMYMVDMLQLQRDMHASSIAVEMQTTTQEDELVDAMIAGMCFIHGHTKASMAVRVAERLMEVVPEAHVDRVNAAWVALNAQDVNAAAAMSATATLATQAQPST